MAENKILPSYCVTCRKTHNDADRPAPCTVENACMITATDVYDEERPMFLNDDGTFIVQSWEEIVSISAWDKTERYNSSNKTQTTLTYPSLSMMEFYLDNQDLSDLDMSKVKGFIFIFHTAYIGEFLSGN